MDRTISKTEGKIAKGQLDGPFLMPIEDVFHFAPPPADATAGRDGHQDWIEPISIAQTIHSTSATGAPNDGGVFFQIDDGDLIIRGDADAAASDVVPVDTVTINFSQIRVEYDTETGIVRFADDFTGWM